MVTSVRASQSGKNVLSRSTVWRATWTPDGPATLRISGKVYQETDMDEGRRKISGYNVEELGLGFIKFAGGVTMDMIESWAIA